MLTNLDATAGYRMMWKNKNPPHWIFMDKKIEVRPDIQAVWEYLPFRNNVFNCVLFDPPHIVLWGTGTPKIAENFGGWPYKRDILPSIFKSIKEFARVSKRLVFKWCDTRDGSTWWKLQSVFRGIWDIVLERKQTNKGMGYGKTWWVSFIRFNGGKED